jgi:RNA polymerase sigma-70 factor (ECF subfamily)
MNQFNDQELIHKFVKGDNSALEVLLKRHKRKLFTYIYHHVRDQAIAQDIFQETFFKIITTLKKGTYNEEGKFLPWAARISHNLIIDHFRAKKKFPQFDGGDEFDIFSVLPLRQGNIEDKMVKKQIKKDLRELIRKLPLDQREVVIMRLYNDMSFKEIAELTNVSINTALGRMRYALINLRKMIEENKLVLTK